MTSAPAAPADTAPISYPTDLTAGETARARARLHAMAADLAAAGALRDPRLRAAFESTWRHPYVPAYYPSKDESPVLCVDPDRRAAWLDAVYSDVTLLTKIVRVPLSPTLAPATANAYTSSSTLPFLLVQMIEKLALQDGNRVLEIGTGTGYNAALLCARHGATNITTVDIDAELTDLARERLAANGHHPTVAAIDGSDGYPDNGPYDRIIATCSVPAIPPAWLHQAAPGAVILADVRGRIGGTLVRLTVDRDTTADGTVTAEGRFVPYWTGFMAMRHYSTAPPVGVALTDSVPVRGLTRVDPALITTPGGFSFALQWQMPDITYGPAVDDDGHPALHVIADDGGHATIATTPDDRGHHRTHEFGTSRIVERLNTAADLWDRYEEPPSDRFGITATPDHQVIWLDDPHTGPRWPLPLREGGNRTA
ncbi:MAG: methyltransferase domain-containing protein [Pseudonocardia sp.]